jgi:hypothetical protein
MLIENVKGNFRFIKGRNPFSSGAVADAGYEIVRAVFDPMLPLDAGFTLIETHLRGIGRPLNALSGMELRIPQALSLEGFQQFNQSYVQRLAAWGIYVGELNLVARTNVALEINPAPVASVFGFSYTVPSIQTKSTFVISGAPEVGVSSANQRVVVAAGDVSPEGMRQKIAQVLKSLHVLLREIDASWADITAVGVYTVQDIYPYLEDMLLREVSSANVHGITWHYARPPVADADFEMDVRRVFQELILPT